MSRAITAPRGFLLSLLFALSFSATNGWAGLTNSCSSLAVDFGRIGLVSKTPRLAVPRVIVEHEHADGEVDLVDHVFGDAEMRKSLGLFGRVRKKFMSGPIFDFIREVMSDYSGRTVGTKTYFGSMIPTSPRYRIQVVFGDRLGLGMHGSVYHLKELSYGNIRYTTKGLVIKVPHKIRNANQPLTTPENGNREEVMVYKLMSDWVPSHIEKIERAGIYPRNPAWGKGSLPIIPILASFTTARFGTMMIKPLINGMGLKEIYARYGKNLPKEMLEDLRGIYNMSAVVNQEIGSMIKDGISKGLIDGRRNALDGNPRNLIWIPKEEVLNLQKVGVPVSREGFYLIEFALRPSSGVNEKTWDQYLQNFWNDLEIFGKTEDEP